jgi:hypothetical protein
MNSFLRAVTIISGLLMPLSVLAQSEGVKAAVDVSVQQQEEIWTGQQVTLNLDLKTTGFSYFNTHFNLPEISGAFLMQTDTTTIRLSEQKNGQSWQILRYPLALYPLKAGELEIPSIKVRFNTSAGYGQEDKAFQFQTTPLVLTVSLPPGVNDGDLVVTTDSFELDYDWQPIAETAHTGDAFTLTVSRRASDISAMLLPPLPVFRTEGLAAYPQAPEIGDQSNRGDLTAERVDKIIWLAEKSGNYDIPGIRFQWWDPDRQELAQQIVPGRSLEILSSPVATSVTLESEQTEPVLRSVLQILGLVLSILAVGAAWLYLKRESSSPDKPSEKSAFSRLQKACQGNRTAETHSAVHAWLSLSLRPYANNSPAPTLTEFARRIHDKQLEIELERLQEALVSSDKNWKGDHLLSALQNVRKKINRQKPGQSAIRLAPLNP